MAESNNKGRMTALDGLNAAVMFVLAGFELGILLQGQQHPGVSAQEVSIMFAECSLVMLGVNALLFFTALLGKSPSTKAHGHRADSGHARACRVDAASHRRREVRWHQSYRGRYRLGVAMGGLAAAAGIGQTLGSSGGGWLFSAIEPRSFGWLAVPLMAMLMLLLLRPFWWSAIADESGTSSVPPALRTPSDALQQAGREPPANT